MTVSGLQRQPTQLDYANPTQFKFSMIKLPKVEYFCTKVELPGLSLGESTQETRFKDIPIPGDKLTYDDLTMSFMVDESLENYREIHGWLVGLGFPTKHSEYSNLVSSGTDRFPISTVSSGATDPGNVSKHTVDQGPILSDATLTILTSKNNPALEVRFKDLYPTALSGLSYDQQASDVTYLTADVTFSYLIYEFATVGSSTTTVTTS